MAQPKKEIGEFSKNSITKIKATLGLWEGKEYVDIREYVEIEGGYTGFTQKGLHLDLEDYKELKKLIEKIDKEIKED